MKSTWLNASAEDVFLPSALNAHSLFEIGSQAYCIKAFLSYNEGFDQNFLRIYPGCVYTHSQIHKNIFINGILCCNYLYLLV